MVRYVEDLLRLVCKEMDSKQGKYWSAAELIHEEDAGVIEAKAWFNKHAPSVITCLKMITEQLQSLPKQLNNNTTRSSGMLKHPTLTSSQFLVQKDES